MPARSKPITAVSALRPGTVNSVVLGSRGTSVGEHDDATGSAAGPLSSRSRRLSRRTASPSRAAIAAFAAAPNPGNSRDILGSGPVPALLATAAQQRSEPQQTLGQDQRADALWAADLVRRKRHKIGAHRIDIKRYFSKGLDRVDMQQSARGMDDFGRLRDRLNRAGFVVGQHDRHQCRRPVRRAPGADGPDPPGRNASRRRSRSPRAETARPQAPRHARSPRPAAAEPGGPDPRRSPGVSASALASVPPEVKTTSRGSAPTAAATAALASSTSRRALRPSAWTEEGLPARSHAAAIASPRLGAKRRGRIPVEIDPVRHGVL